MTLFLLYYYDIKSQGLKIKKNDLVDDANMIIIREIIEGLNISLEAKDVT